MGRSFSSSHAGKMGKMSKSLEVFKDGGQWMSSSSYRVIVVPSSRQNKIWVPHLGRTKGCPQKYLTCFKKQYVLK